MHGISSFQIQWYKASISPNVCFEKYRRFFQDHEKFLRVNVSKNQRNRGHGQKIDFAHTLSV